MEIEEFVESGRDQRTCDCGCGKRWLLSRGRLGATSFVVMPTVHGNDRVAWLALGVGDRWALLRSWLNGENVAAGVAEPEQSPLGAVVGNALSRAQVIGDPAGKARLFGVHDALLKRHPDLKHLFVPEQGRDYSFQMPDCVHALPPAQRSKRNNLNFAEHGDRLFVRALLPIPVGDGTELRIGVWIEVPPDAFFGLMKVWDDEAVYMKQRLTGPIENSMQAGGNDICGATVTLAPRTPDQCLFVADSATPWLATLIRDGVSIVEFPRLVNEIERSVRRHAQA